MAIRFLVKSSQYFDSIALMNIAKRIKEATHLDEVALVMGTEANKRILAQLGPLSSEAQAATPTDLILALVGEDLESAQEQAEKMLRMPPPTKQASAQRPKRLKSAAQLISANLAMISVPGDYASQEAWTALQNGMHVFIFSDNVPINEEIKLKQFASQKGLLVMGPGAGTAIINGIALGFANVVPRGSVGIISAAGTGLQEVSTQLAKLGSGVSQAIGVGGRDLSDSVAGCMTLVALEQLKSDPETERIIIISKRPSPQVGEKVLAELANAGKPVIVAFMTQDEFELPPNVHHAKTLQEAAYLACDKSHLLANQAEKLKQQARTLEKKATYLRGLFSGGTLCQEAIRLWSAEVGGIWSNTPLNPDFRLPDAKKSHQHSAIDLGEEEFTLGRPHPMIDSSLRIERLFQECNDPEVAVIQMDVVLGYSANPNPSAELAPAITQALAKRPDLIILISITGTENDPQKLSQQSQAFTDAGAIVLGSNAEAAQLAGYIIHEQSI